MSKDTFYFSHDYNARADDKIKGLIRKHGMIGYGVFWSIVEDLYNNANALHLDYDGIAYDLRVDSKLIKSVIHDFDLFVFENNTFGSLSVEKRLNERNIKSNKARESALYRWSKSNPDANAMRTQCDGNAIKERKGKEIKGKEKKEKNIFDYSFIDKNWINLFNRWLAYKKSRNESYKTQDSLEACYRNLQKLSMNNINTAAEIIDQAMGNNWQGLFPLKQNNKPYNNDFMSDLIKQRKALENE